MGNLLARLNIRQKLWSGYGIILTILLLVGLVAFVSFARTEGGVETMVEEVQPVVQASMTLQERLEEGNAALGFYLLSGEQRYRDEFETAVEEVEATLNELSKMPAVANSKNLSERLEAIEAAFHDYLEYRDQLLELPQDSEKNFPGVAYAARNINPVSQQVLQILSEALMAERSQPATEERKELLTAFQDLRYQWSNVMNGVRAYLAFRGQSAVDEVRLYQEATADKAEELMGMSHLFTFEQEMAMEDFMRLHEELFENFDELLAIQDGDRWRTDAFLLRTELAPIIDRISRETSAMVENQQRRIDTIGDGLRSEVTAVGFFVAVMSVGGLVLGALVAWWVACMITGPLDRTVHAMRDIAAGEGDLTARLEIHSGDEIGQLAEAFNDFTAKIHQLVERVGQAIERLATTAEQTSRVAGSTGEGVQQQKSQTEQVAAAMNEMATTVQEVSGNAQQGAEAAGNASQAADEGRRVVHETMAAIRGLADEVNEAADVIQQLGTETDSIGEVLNVIREISEQTNLLALNAAIEAARAGEAGRGFAVVADEVRNLATRTHESVEEIQNTVEKLQTGARGAVDTMQGSRERAGTTVEQAGNTEEALDRIADAVGHINSMNEQIASSSEEQRTVADDINRNINEIATIAEHSAEGAGQLTQSSEELNQLVAELKELVGQFRTRGNG
ncbi:MAG: HAMP domain-containing methyl-accepting chemotaxis protein [Pseudomonadota bacterium]